MEVDAYGAPIQKATNPKDSVGTKKAPFSTIPANVLGEIGVALLEGARKYGRHNYRDIGVRESVYYDAAMRHLTAWWEGEDIDPQSGVHHVTKALASLVVLRDAQMNDNATDDRPPRPKEWMENLNATAADIVERIPDPKLPHIESKDA